MLIHNANILSYHKGFQNGSADSIFVENKKIKAIGKFADLQSFLQSETQIIDAKGKTILPGFNDSHVHVWKVGNLKTHLLDLRGVASKEEMLTKLHAYALDNPDKNWLLARGFNEANWQNKQLPDKNDLDKISINKPIYFIRTCAHIAVCNSKALEIANINHYTVAPVGGVIYKGADGKPNGILSETALGLVSKFIPPYSKADLKEMIHAAVQEFHQLGITAATDPAVDPLLLKTYYDLNEAKSLGIRLNALPIILPDGGEKANPIPDFFDSPFFKVNAVKFFSDGGLSGKTAALKGFYKNTKEKGVLRLNRNRYVDLSFKSMDKGLGIATHAIGDEAIDFVIDVYKELHKTFPTILNRIEHLALPSKKNLEDMHQNHIATSMQTIFLNELGTNFHQYLDEQYLENCYPVKTVLKSGVLTALSSDAPVVKNLNPFKGIEAAITRLDANNKAIALHESIDIDTALQLYTSNAAKLSHQENLGSLAAGNYADFIIVDKNPLKENPSNLQNISVEQTFIDGKCVYSKYENHE